jgi:hypothetical protein
MKFKIHKVWHTDVYDKDNTLIESVMFHTKWEAEQFVKQVKRGEVKI